MTDSDSTGFIAMIKTALHYKSGNNGVIFHLRLEKLTLKLQFYIQTFSITDKLL